MLTNQEANKKLSRQEEKRIHQACDDLYDIHEKDTYRNNYIHHYCCFVTHKRSNAIGEKISIGKNNLTPQHCTPTLHAEIDAYHKLPAYYKSLDLDIIVVRFTSSGKLCQSRPCYHCIKKLTEFGLSIKNVYYSKNECIHKEKFSDMMNSSLTKISSGMRNKNKNKNTNIYNTSSSQNYFL